MMGQIDRRAIVRSPNGAAKTPVAMAHPVKKRAETMHAEMMVPGTVIGVRKAAAMTTRIELARMENEDRVKPADRLDQHRAATAARECSVRNARTLLPVTESGVPMGNGLRKPIANAAQTIRNDPGQGVCRAAALAVSVAEVDSVVPVDLAPAVSGPHGVIRKTTEERGRRGSTSGFRRWSAK